MSSDQIGEEVFTKEDIQDAERLGAMPDWLAAIARKHSLPLFDLAFNALAATERLTLMSQMIRARDAQVNLNIIAQSMDHIAKVGLKALGKELTDFHACCEEIQRACALAQGADTTSARAKSGIILPN